MAQLNWFGARDTAMLSADKETPLQNIRHGRSPVGTRISILLTWHDRKTCGVDVRVRTLSSLLQPPPSLRRPRVQFDLRTGVSKWRDYHGKKGEKGNLTFWMSALNASGKMKNCALTVPKYVPRQTILFENFSEIKLVTVQSRQNVE